ncbi:hypothetical protein L4C34_17225 [Vibrio profundum]|uniref:hypothetical protein n=1 Tax=Vibrio profundum TaxID=2910247 RepID=UPI003D1349D9
MGEELSSSQFIASKAMWRRKIPWKLDQTETKFADLSSVCIGLGATMPDEAIGSNLTTR